MAARSSLVALCAAASVGAASSENVVFASSPLVKWVGRTSAPQGQAGPVLFDWEGVSATVTVAAPYSYVAANITDACAGTNVGGGSRWLVTMTTSDPLAAAAAHRVSTFWTGPLTSFYYLFSVPGARCDPDCSLGGNLTLTLTRLTESRLSGCSAAAGLSVNSFSTDGVFAAPPPAAGRRLEFVGDSISAGDLNDGSGQARCGNAAYNDDITLSTGGQLCLPVAQGGFGADCMFTAWGGITLGGGEAAALGSAPGSALGSALGPASSAGGWGMTELYPFTFSASGTDAYGPWDPTSFPADAVVINLGTNDRPAPPATAWQERYASFVQSVVAGYKRQPADLPVFLAYGPMTNEYEPFVQNISATLTAGGYKAFALDLTLPTPMTGCYGHPSAADNVLIAAKAKPQIAAVLGW